MKTDRPLPGCIDGHVDLVYEMMRHHAGVPFPRLATAPVTLEKLKSADIRIIASACYCPDQFNGAGTALPHALSLISYSMQQFSGLVHINSAQDLEACFLDSSRPGYILTLENSDSLLEFDLDEVKEKGIRIVGLTHAGKNRLGDGNSVNNPEGLTASGRQLVRKLHSKGFALDVAHLSAPGFRQLTGIFNGRLLSSHTGFRFFYDIPRNLSRDQLSCIIERGGIVGVTLNPEMLSGDGRAGIEEVFRHIDWVAQNHGPDHVAIGSDFCGFDQPNRDLPDISTLPLIQALLEKRGYPAESIRRIMGLNWYRLYSDLFREASAPRPKPGISNEV